MTRNDDWMSDNERLTILNHLLRSTLVSNGSPFTLYDRMEALGLEPARLLQTAQPMSSPPLPVRTYGRLARWPQP